jgi:glutathione S-transferase
MCPFAQKINIGLNLLKCKYENVEIDLYGNKPNWFYDLNPKGEIPVLKYYDEVIVDSERILTYITTTIPDSNSNPNQISGQNLVLNASEEEYIRRKITESMLPIGKSCVYNNKIDSKLNEHLFEISEIIGDKPYMMGNHISTADICAFPFLYRLDTMFRFEINYPNLKNWIITMMSNDEVSRTVASSWWWWW